MSVANCVCLQLGQCGTQVGHEFISGLYDDCCVQKQPWKKGHKQVEYIKQSMPVFFNETCHESYEARSVMVDMEPKAVTWAIESSKSKNWKYPKGQQLCKKSGSGNNWSYGHQIHGPKCAKEVLNLIRKEVEKCDRFGGFFVLMSLAGGTGSGIGSYMLEKLHDNYSQSPILNTVVLPYSAGEVAVQNYNAILTLSSVISNADASILLHNDNLHLICKKLLLINKVSFKDLNKVAAHDLGSLFQHCTSTTNNSNSSIHNILRSTSAHSIYKFLNLKSVPHIADKSVAYSTFNWNALLKRMHQMHITNSSIDEGMDWHADTRYATSAKYPKSLANLLILRGNDSSTLSTELFQDERFYVPWIPRRETCHIWSSSQPFMGHEKSITLLNNGSFCINGLNGIMQKGWGMFSAKAYLHQYRKYGLDEEDFLNAFIKIENVLKTYATL